MANWANPQLTSTYTDFMNQLKDRDTDLALQFDGTTSSNLSTGTIRWNSSINRWQKWSGASWGELASTYALTGLSTTGNASIGGTLTVTGSTSLATATATTPATADNSTAVATTAWVKAQGYSGATTGTSANTPNTLVQRDAAGNFAANSLTLAGTFSVTGATTLSSFSYSGNIDTTATAYLRVPSGNTNQRPANPSSGMVRYNTNLGQYEGHNGSTWGSLGTTTFATHNEVDGYTTTGTNAAGNEFLVLNPGPLFSLQGYYIVGKGIYPGTIVVSSVPQSNNIVLVTMSQNSDTASAGLSNEPVSFYPSNVALSPGNTAGRLARAWVNFNGSGTVAIRAAYNVRSITDDGVGSYTVNFSTAFVDTNYCFLCTGQDTASGVSSNTPSVGARDDAQTPVQTGLLKIGSVIANGSSALDCPNVCVAVFR